MIKTKMTIPVRVLGVIGTLVLVASLYLPWATIHGKELLDTSGTYSAMELVRGKSQYISYAFMGVYFILILSLFTLIYSIVGRPTVAMGITQFITAGTYLTLLILLGSFFQGVMPGDFKLPGVGDTTDTDGDGLSDMIEEMVVDVTSLPSDSELDIDELDINDLNTLNINNPDTDGDSFNDFEELIINKTNPFDRYNKPYSSEQREIFDTAREMYNMTSMLTNTTVKPESGIYITTGSCVFLVIVGIMLKIDRKRRKNLKIELKYHKKDLGAYKMCIEQALLDGFISEDELGMLNMQRRSMGINEEEHYTIVIGMAEGRKADEQCMNELLSILDGNYQYRGEEGAFGRRRRPGRRPPPPREGRSGPPREGRSGPPREGRPGPPREGRPGPPREGRPGPPREGRSGPPRGRGEYLEGSVRRAEVKEPAHPDYDEDPEAYDDSAPTEDKAEKDEWDF